MKEYLAISLCEAVVFLYLWPRLAEKMTDWSSRSVQRNNPHLRICFYARKWITPVLFIVFSCVAIGMGLNLTKELFDIVLLNMLVVIITLLIGGLLTQYVVEHYMTGHKHFF